MPRRSLSRLRPLMRAMREFREVSRVKIGVLNAAQIQTMAVHDKHHRLLSYSSKARIAHSYNLEGASATAQIELGESAEIVSVEVHYRKIRPQLPFATVEGIRSVEGSVQMSDLDHSACDVFVCEGRYPYVGFNDAEPDLFVSGHGLLFAIREQRLIGIGMTNITERSIK
ncbi:hypothetical protein MCEMSE15_00230 [Fimbriimonadaceae bacterium]